MTITNTTLASSTYNGNGSTTAFATGFQFISNSDLQVIVTSADGTETIKTITTHYTVTGAGNPSGGTVTFLVAPITGERVNIRSNVTIDQQTDYTEGGSFSASTHETALDKLTKICQQLKEISNRSVKVPITNQSATMQTNSISANYVLRVNSAGNGVEWVTPVNAALSTTLTPSNNYFIVGDGSAWTSKSPSDSRSSMGLGTIATQDSDDITITGGSVSGITDLSVSDGGTGASNAEDARYNLGLEIGVDVLAYDPDISAIAGLVSSANKLPYFTGSGTAALADFTAAGRALLDDANAAAQRTTLGLAIGTNVQAYDATLDALSSFNTNGLLTQTAENTFTGRTLTGTSNQITITNGDGVSGNPTISLPATLDLGSSSTSPSSISFFEDADNGTNKVIVSAPSSLSGDVTFTLPASNGTNNYVLKTDGSGNTSWTAPSGGGITSPLTTKGDIWVYGSSDDRLPVGTNTYVLTADSSEVTGLKWAAPSAGTGTALSFSVTQSSHGFSVGNLIYHTGSAYAKAQADTAAKAEVVGIVSAVADVNTFTLMMSGEITGLSSLTAGAVYFLDPSTAGAATATEPSTAGQISKPVFIAISTTAARLCLEQRGSVISSAGTLSEATQADMETGTSTTTYVSPAKSQFHPSAAKSWLQFHHATGVPTIDSSYNVTSLSDVAQGRVGINFTVNMSSANYAISVTGEYSIGVYQTSGFVDTAATASSAGTAKVNFGSAAAGALDISSRATVVCFGDQ